MKKRSVLFSILAIMLVAATILFTLLLWPCSYSDILGVDQDSVTHISAYAGIDILEDGQTVLQHYRMDSIPLSGEGSYEEVLGILNECRFRRNIRNLLPWIDDEYEYPTTNKDYDGNTLRLVYHLGSEQFYVAVDFYSSSLMMISENEFSDFLFYHPTNHETLGKLIEFIHTYGIPS